MPIDKSKINDLMETVKYLEQLGDIKQKNKPKFTQSQVLGKIGKTKKPKISLNVAEKQIYFQISHYFRLTMISIPVTAIALETWTNTLLPTLLEDSNLPRDEWVRLCDIGDNDEEMQEELDKNWFSFYKEKIKKKLIDKRILMIIGRARQRALQDIGKKSSNKRV